MAELLELARKFAELWNSLEDNPIEQREYMAFLGAVSTLPAVCGTAPSGWRIDECCEEVGIYRWCGLCLSGIVVPRAGHTGFVALMTLAMNAYAEKRAYLALGFAANLHEWCRLSSSRALLELARAATEVAGAGEPPSFAVPLLEEGEVVIRDVSVVAQPEIARIPLGGGEPRIEENRQILVRRSLKWGISVLERVSGIEDRVIEVVTSVARRVVEEGGES